MDKKIPPGQIKEPQVILVRQTIYYKILAVLKIAGDGGSAVENENPYATMTDDGLKMLLDDIGMFQVRFSSWWLIIVEDMNTEWLIEYAHTR